MLSQQIIVIAFVLASSSTLVQAKPTTVYHNSEKTLGFAYEPFYHPNYPTKDVPNAKAILYDILLNDFLKIREYTNVIRTYYTSYYGQSVAEVANITGLHVYLGVFMSEEHWAKKEPNNAIMAAKKFPYNIKGILVGNENIHPVGKYDPVALVRIIKRVQSGLKKHKLPSIPVGTSQRINEWLKSEDIEELADACDVIGVNVYPFFKENIVIGEAIQCLEDQWELLLNKYTATKLMITETGWPSKGIATKSGDPSPLNAAQYYHKTVQWNNAQDLANPVFYFSFSDRNPTTEPNLSPEFEYSFGLFHLNGTEKFSLTTPP